MMFTLGQAAKAAGISKSTLSKAIHTGRISARKTETGNFEIDPAELFRVYPANAGVFVANSSPERHRTAGEHQAEHVETAALRAEIDGLRAQLALLKDQNDDLKSQRDGWQRQAENAQRLLVDQRQVKRGGLFGLFKAG